jgi:four helix bundle protein
VTSYFVQEHRSAQTIGQHVEARSKADFVSKLGIVLEEADEALYWMEILTETRVVEASQVQSLMKEGNELIAILVSTINTSKLSK